ncbi:MAG: HAMP domain-containing protein [Nitrospiraceae bacterium]|jgi:signal transduction histidine kinase|nr:HAMP domain-containing protein [Nitrospiraceae bacterium]
MDYKPSIRQKISLGYYAGVGVIFALFLFTLTELSVIDKKIMFADVIAEFFETTLEMRRYEKNFFLYQQREDFEESIRYVSRAEEILAKHQREYENLLVSAEILHLRKVLQDYRKLLEQYASLAGQPAARASVLKHQIRERGKELTTLAETISATEKNRIRELLTNAERILFVSIFIFSLAGLGVGHLISRMVVKPLKELEEKMEQIAAGGFSKMVIATNDREIVSLTNAFNKMLRELQIRQKHLVQSEKLASLGTLMAGIAHELNNPLSNISSSSQILMEELDDSDKAYRQELLQQIESQTDRARNIVRSLLDFSREKTFKRETINLHEVLHETVRFVRGQLPPTIDLQIDIPDSLVIYADKQRIQQAFLNLLKNAIDAMPAGGSLQISASSISPFEAGTFDQTEAYTFLVNRDKCEPGEESAYIIIRDSGAGIPPEILPRIMDPFFSTKEVGKGSGLGLSIVHEIIDEHEGCIAVVSTVGKGTAFVVRLPSREGLAI